MTILFENKGNNLLLFKIKSFALKLEKSQQLSRIYQNGQEKKKKMARKNQKKVKKSKRK